jgi:ribosomal protein L37AE/L43A
MSRPVTLVDILHEATGEPRAKLVNIVRQAIAIRKCPQHKLERQSTETGTCWKCKHCGLTFRKAVSRSASGGRHR